MRRMYFYNWQLPIYSSSNRRHGAGHSAANYSLTFEISHGRLGPLAVAALNDMTHTDSSDKSECRDRAVMGTKVPEGYVLVPTAQADCTISLVGTTLRSYPFRSSNSASGNAPAALFEYSRKRFITVHERSSAMVILGPSINTLLPCLWSFERSVTNVRYRSSTRSISRILAQSSFPPFVLPEMTFLNPSTALAQLVGATCGIVIAAIRSFRAPKTCVLL